MKKLIMFLVMAIALFSFAYANPSVPTLTYPANNTAYTTDGNGYVIENATIIATDSAQSSFYCSALNPLVSSSPVTWFVLNNTVTEFPVIILKTTGTPSNPVVTTNTITLFCSYDTDNISTYSPYKTYSFTLTKEVYTEGDIPKATIDAISRAIITVGSFAVIVVLLLIIGFAINKVKK